MEYVEPCNVRVTKIKNRWHVRVFYNDKLYSEYACEARQDIGWCAREQLRWVDKCGGMSRFADAARKRHAKDPAPVGKIWYNIEHSNAKQNIQVQH